MMERQYPRPQLKRSEWLNLNGEWNFDFDDSNRGIQDKWYESHEYSKKIRVPFAYQSKLSGIHDVSIHDRVWYQRKFNVKETNKRVILHFEGVDYEAHCFVNHKLAYTHVGGSTGFSFDITDFIVSGTQDLAVMVFDPSLDPLISRGKQTVREQPYECFYDRTTGIWQTVWIEYIDESAVKALRITPCIDRKTVNVKLMSFDSSRKEVIFNIFDGNTKILEKNMQLDHQGCIEIQMPEDLKLWSPESPHLYDMNIKVFKNHLMIDEIDSYFGMRKISIHNNQIRLNNEPYYLRLVLDQGYYPEGLLSYPSETDLENDILIAKKMGFNGARKHQKIEAERFLYYADKLGYLVSLEMPSQYEFSADQRFVSEWLSAIDRDYNHPSLFMYVPFNESWGVKEIHHSLEQQDYVKAIYHLTKSIDPSRIVVSNDGWEQPITEVCTIHSYRHGKIGDLQMHQTYYRSLTDLESLLSSIHTDGNKPIYVGDEKHHNEPIIFSEFGGVSFANQSQNGWGYTGVTNETDLISELSRIFLAVYDSKHLAGFCFTQLSDVEQEINGLLTYDRKPKLPLDVIRKIVENTK